MTVILEQDTTVLLPGTKLLYETKTNVEKKVRTPHMVFHAGYHPKMIDVITRKEVTQEVDSFTCTNKCCSKEQSGYAYRIVSRLSFAKGEKIEYTYGCYCSLECLSDTLAQEYIKMENYRNKWLNDPNCLSYTRQKLLTDSKITHTQSLCIDLYNK